MINANNKEIRITLSKRQADWLDKLCNKAKITKSKYISWLLSRKAEELVKVLKYNDTISEEELLQMLEELEAQKRV